MSRIVGEPSLSGVGVCSAPTPCSESFINRVAIEPPDVLRYGPVHSISALFPPKAKGFQPRCHVSEVPHATKWMTEDSKQHFLRHWNTMNDRGIMAVQMSRLASAQTLKIRRYSTRDWTLEGTSCGRKSNLDVEKWWYVAYCSQESPGWETN